MSSILMFLSLSFIETPDVMLSVEVCSNQETVRDWKVKERFPGRSTGSYSILKVSSEPGHPAILADSDIQFQDSSKVNYSTIKVCSEGRERGD